MASVQTSSGNLIIIGASTGGPRAVEGILAALPASINAGIVVALHMPAAFTGPYASRLNRASGMSVREGCDGARILQGDAVILPGGCQAEVSRLGTAVHLTLRPSSAGDLYAPSADSVMRSAARSLRQEAVGVILTGMGGDGAAGLAEIRSAGGYTIAESKDSAVIYGMPAEAVRKGGAMAQLALGEIPGALLARCGLCPVAAPTDDPPLD